MITTTGGLDTRVNIQQIIENQLPEFLLSDSPNSVEFFKAYYLSQEHQGGTIDIIDNLDQYLKLDNLTPEVVGSGTTLSIGIGTDDKTIFVDSTKGFPKQYGLFKINDEIITYSGIGSTSFTGCIRGFCGITTYNSSDNPGQLIFSTSSADVGIANTTVTNLSSLFLKEFYKKQKFSLTPELENSTFVPSLNAGNFIKEASTLYQSKGTEESFRILFNVLYGVTPKIIDLESLLLKPSAAEFIRREVLVCQIISGDPLKLKGQSVTKSTDSATRGAVSDVEPLTTKEGNLYYKVSLFVGFNDVDLITGTFTIPGKTKAIGNIGSGTSIVTVDSTVGFNTSGTFISGINTVTYTDKTINQFLNCSGITSSISTSSDIRADEVIFGYENGDLTKKVELRITGVISDFKPVTDIILSTEGEEVGIRNLGEQVLNPETDKSYKEINSNSWIYNTASRFQIKTPYNASNRTTPELLTDVDKSQLRKGDKIEILVRNEQTPQATAVVDDKITGRQINLGSLTPSTFVPAFGQLYDIRRQLKTASSSSIPLEFGNNTLTSDITNIYVETTKNVYAASNSLPSYEIEVGVAKTNASDVQNFNNISNKFSEISFGLDVPFITGDEVIYKPTNDPIPGLESGAKYFVRVRPPVGNVSNKINLYISASFIAKDLEEGTSTFVEFGDLPTGTNSGTHKFILSRHSSEVIGSQKLLKQFPTEPNIENGNSVKTLPGKTGMLINGVEISNYKSFDKIYSGPLTKVSVFKKGNNYDIINPPTITISDSPTGSGTTALVQPVIIGQIEDVQVDQQDFDIDSVNSITVKGGNGTGAVLQPIVTQRFREISFDGRERVNAIVGGVDINNETIIFNKTHNLNDGQALIYDSNGNDSIGINSFGGANTPQIGTGTTNPNATLHNGAVYFPKVVGVGNSVRLFPSKADFIAGINTVGFANTHLGGTHKFRIKDGKNHLRSVKVLDSGQGYANRKLFVKPVGVSTIRDSIYFESHGFKNNELIQYSVESGGTSISGLSTANQYRIIKLSDDEFRIANAGVGGTITSNYKRNNYIHFNSKGDNYQIFEYPPIELVIDAKYSKVAIALTESLVLTPIVRGSIEQSYLYHTGTGYGSTVLNFEKKPVITITIGELGIFKPIIKEGKVIAVDIENQGQDYSAPPDLLVEGDGFGASLRAIVENNKVINVKILNSGTGYTTEKTSILVTPPGSESLLESNVRELNVNLARKNVKKNNDPDKSDIVSQSGSDSLGYSFVGYSANTGKEQFGDDGSTHSPIIGWAYDGNPIYGPYGHSDPMDINSKVILLTPGYVRDIGNVNDRPIGFHNGFFVEDYNFDGSGDLDDKNGRYCRTPDYPNGVYAYFAGISTNSKTSTLEPKFPYFIGDSYRSDPPEENFSINQSTYDFNKKTIARNTFPYKVADPFANNDFIVESNELVDQISFVDSISKGVVDDFDIIESGSGYKVGENASFDNTGTNGGGLTASIKSLTGKDLLNINTNVENWQNVVFIWDSPNQVSGYISTSHSLKQRDNIIVSGLSTTISGLTRHHQIGITTSVAYLYKDLGTSATVGVVTDIYVSTIPSFVSVGDNIGIGAEKLKILNIFDDRNILRVTRGISGAAHSLSTQVNYLSNYFSIPVKTSYFTSRANDVVYFNPNESIGVGTIAGTAATVNVSRGTLTVPVSIDAQSIFLPNHPFTQNQRVSLNIPIGSNQISISTISGLSPSPLGVSGGSVDVFVINKSKDFIGITTQIGICTNGVFFHNNGSSGVSTYFFESDYTQVTGKIEKVVSTVSISTSISTSHGMLNNDVISLKINPSETIGIGASTAVRVKFNSTEQKLLVDPVVFGASSVNTTTNTLNISSHNLITGQKIFYDGGNNQIAGLSTGVYYTYRVDDNNFRLGDTRKDVLDEYPIIVNLTSTGGSNQEFSLINPPISVVRDNNLKFDLSDSSLTGYDFKLFYDSKFNNEFVSTGTTTTNLIVETGTIGSATASFTLNHHTDTPNLIYYTLEKSGFISTSDVDVVNFSQINYETSSYNGQYNISGVGVTTFDISLKSVPDNLSYTNLNTNILKYSTTSKIATGGIDKMSISFGGIEYKKLPKFTGITSTNGINANISPKSKTANRINSINIINQGFEYASDPTLRPEALISPIVTIRDSGTLTDVSVITGGKNYIIPPKLIVVDPTTNERVDNGKLDAVLASGGIVGVDIVDPSKGLSSLEQRIVSVDNTNGITIDTVEYDGGNNRVTCTLATPTLGFNEPPFAVGDKIFVENIEKIGTAGDGFNSDNHGFKFFTVLDNTQGSALDATPVKVAFSLDTFTNNPGTPVLNQNGYAILVNETDVPSFTSIQDLGLFRIGEKISVLNNNSFIPTDLKITSSVSNSIKVFGKFRLKLNDRIKGDTSGTRATINTLVENLATFDIDFSLRRDSGWNDETGKLSIDSQVLPDNDYYQNLSYAVQSPLEYESLINSVNSLLHPSGLKNFANVGIGSTTNVGISTNDNVTVINQDLITNTRVDQINIFDNAKDIDVSLNRSRFLEIAKKKLTSYIECKTNRVLKIDDIGSEFASSSILGERSADIIVDSEYANLLVQTIDTLTNNIQATELTIFRDSTDIFTLEKANLSNTNNSLVDINSRIENNLSLISIVPKIVNSNYTIKIYNSTFNTSLVGISTQSIGFIDLVGVTTTVGIGSSTNIISVDKDELDAYKANFEITEISTDEKSIVDLYLTHDDTDTYKAEVFTDTGSLASFSSNFIGTFHSNITNGILQLNYENTSSSQVSVKTKIVGFGTTASGISTYHFKDPGQADGTERSMRLESSFLNIGVSTGGIAFDNTSPNVYAGDSPSGISSTNVSTIKSNIRVSIGDISAIHQLLTVRDGSDVYTTQYPFVSIGTTTGIGTFKSNVTDAIRIQFIPDSQWNGQPINIQRFDEIIYTDSDKLNIAPDLTYGSITESLSIFEYVSAGDDIDKKEFDLKHKNVHIFEKTFNPSGTGINTTTGLFTITDHFFNTGEKLIYTPTSTFTGIAGTAMQMSNGSVLPTEVFAVRETKDTFKLATSKANATATIPTTITFTGQSGGNLHKLEMFKKLSKSIVLVDGLIQSPLSYTPTTTTLQSNGGTVGTGKTIFNVVGISSIIPTSILKINDEYLRVNLVGIGTSNSGPISGIGTYNLVSAERGYVGTSTASHSDGDIVRLYSGSFNIIGSKIHFTDPPKGAATTNKNTSNLSFPQSAFDGRVYLRQDYTSNRIFDDISQNFNGISSSFTMKVGGANTTGISTGSTLILLNGIFQQPSTSNNAGQDYSFFQTGAGHTGITSAIFTGITTVKSNGNIGTIVQDTSDPNANQLPRGGILVSVASTGGMGVAPLQGAIIRPLIGAGKSISGFIGIPTTGASLAISTASYDNVSGEMQITTETDHNFRYPNEFVRLRDLEFTCSGYSGAGTTTIFPDTINDKPFSIISIESRHQFTANVGVSTIPHTFLGSFGPLQRTGIASAYYADLNVGSGYFASGIGVTVSVEDLEFEHRFVSSGINSITANSGGPFTATNADYVSSTGVLTLTIPNHGLTLSNTLGITTGGLVFTCSRDNFTTVHPYPRPTDPAAGIALTITSVSTNQLTVNVGPGGGSGTGANVTAAIGAGGTLTFDVTGGGNGYVNPVISVSPPSYENLPVVGVSRLGVGATTELGNGTLVSVEVGSGTSVGIGTTLVSVKSFKFVNSGFGYQVGDVFKPVGLVTSSQLSQLVSDLEFTVTETFTDKFSAWDFGEFDYIDSIYSLQDGQRVRFPLKYEGNIVSFEVDKDDPQSSLIDLEPLLLIFVNGVLQNPGESYIFAGGTSIIFAVSPTVNDNIDIFFYRGTVGVDSKSVTVKQSLKRGDIVTLIKGKFDNSKPSQDSRTITNLTQSDTLKTNLYYGQGIEPNVDGKNRPLRWAKQKVNKVIEGEIVYKNRDLYEPQIFPTSKIIADVAPGDTNIFVDNAQAFDIEKIIYNSNAASVINDGETDGLVIPSGSVVAAAITAIVSAAGTISSLSIVNGGQGYVGSSTSLVIGIPTTGIGVGVGTTATATATITNGGITTTTIVNSGFGYTLDIPPQVIAPTPFLQTELIQNITAVEGFSGIITGISTTRPTSTKLALEFYLSKDSGNYSGLGTGDPIYIYDTTVGSGVTSLWNNNNNNVVGIGTTFLDNIYRIKEISSDGTRGLVTCFVHTGLTTSTIGNYNAAGIATVTPVGLNSESPTSLGKFSWGKLTGITRSTLPIAIGVTGSTIGLSTALGITTFPTIQRRGDGFNDSGAVGIVS